MRKTKTAMISIWVTLFNFYKITFAFTPSHAPSHDDATHPRSSPPCPTITSMSSAVQRL